MVVDGIIDEIKDLVKDWSEDMRISFLENILEVYGIAKGWAVAGVANYLFSRGCTAISFKERVLLPNNLAAYVDVYSSNQNIYVICATTPNLSWVKDRVAGVKGACPGAKVLAAFQDVAGWLVNPTEVGADQVLIVGRDGIVLDIEEWRRSRRATLEGALVKFKDSFIGLKRRLNELKRLGAEAERARRAEGNLITCCLLDVARALSIEMDVSGLLEGRLYRAPQDDTIKEYGTKVKLLTAKMLKAFIEFANVLLSYYTPFNLLITDEGDLSIGEDLKRTIWLKDFIFGEGGISTALLALRREIAVLSEIAGVSEDRAEPFNGS
jgi:hypothetical protein